MGDIILDVVALRKATLFSLRCWTIVSSHNRPQLTYCIKGSVTTLLVCAAVLRCVAAIGLDRDSNKDSESEWPPSRVFAFLCAGAYNRFCFSAG
jgi:hypothetical protein